MVTADKELVVRHDITLDKSTNVATVFDKKRARRKIVDGTAVEGYFVEDFTLSEIKSLKATQSKLYRDQSFNNLFEIPTFEDVIEFINRYEKTSGKKVSIFPEFKHPTYHRYSGHDIERLFLDAILNLKFTNTDRIKVQAFEIESLMRVKALFDAHGLGDIEIVQAMGKSRATANPSKAFEIPYDVHFNVQKGNDLESIYGPAIIGALTDPMSTQITWHDFASSDVLGAMRDTYLDSLSIWVRDIVLREKLVAPVDGNGDGDAEIKYIQTGKVSAIVDNARNLGINTYAFTLKDEERFQTLSWDGSIQTPEEEISLLVSLCLDGVVTDFVDTAVLGVSLPNTRSFPSLVNSPECHRR